MNPDGQHNQLGTVIRLLSDGTRVRLIQVPGKSLNTATGNNTDLHIFIQGPGSPLSLESGFNDKSMEKDIILFTRLRNGSKLLRSVTEGLLSRFLGRACTALIDKTETIEDPPSNTDLMARISETMGTTQLIIHAIAEGALRRAQV